MRVDAPPTDPPSERWRTAAIGVAAGFLSGLLGIGGGLVMVPALIGLLAMDRRRAHGTSLAAAIPVASSALATYAYNDNVDWSVAGCFALGAVGGAIVGTHLLQIIPKRPLTIIFTITILLTATRLLIGSDATGRDELTALMMIALVGIGFVTGVLSGLLGVGGGVVLVPAMIVLLSMPAVVAKGTSVAVIVPTSVMGTIRNRSRSNVDLRAAAAIGIVGVVSAVVGGTLSDMISDDVSNVLFASLLVIVAWMQLRSIRPTPTASLAPSEA